MIGAVTFCLDVSKFVLVTTRPQPSNRGPAPTYYLRPQPKNLVIGSFGAFREAGITNLRPIC